jgi:hypothetical protein
MPVAQGHLVDDDARIRLESGDIRLRGRVTRRSRNFWDRGSTTNEQQRIFPNVGIVAAPAREAKIAYSLRQSRDEALLIEVNVPGER